MGIHEGQVSMDDNIQKVRAIIDVSLTKCLVPLNYNNKKHVLAHVTMVLIARLKCFN